MQGKTIECLKEKTKVLSKMCLHQVHRVTELQADDYHLDRPLYYACRIDRERFCDEIAAGSGRVFDCLARHKFERDMSDAVSILLMTFWISLVKILFLFFFLLYYLFIFF